MLDVAAYGGRPVGLEVGRANKTTVVASKPRASARTIK